MLGCEIGSTFDGRVKIINTLRRNTLYDPADALVDVKVSDDDGETWQRRKISMVSGMDESGLNAGELFQLNGEKFRVLSGEDGMMVEQIKKPRTSKIDH